MAKGNIEKKAIIKSAFIKTFTKLNPLVQLKNPVMFIVYICSIFTTILFCLSVAGIGQPNWGYVLGITIILWFTVLFGNFAEALAEGRGKAQADALKKTKQNIIARKLEKPEYDSNFIEVKSEELKIDDIVLVKAGEQIPMDGEVIVGAASVDESAITGESAPVIRESGGDRSAVTGGTTVLSDWLIIKVTTVAGESFLDKMISMVEGGSRKKTPNEIALQIFLTTLTIIFLIVSASLYAFTDYLQKALGITEITALTICLAPTTVGALLSSIGIAGMARLNKANVLAKTGRAIESAGDVNVLLLDKTGTITYGNRQACEFIPISNVKMEDLVYATHISSLHDETAEGRSIVVLAEKEYKNKVDIKSIKEKIEYIEFSAKTRMSGIDIGKSKSIRKGSGDAIKFYVESNKGKFPKECQDIVNKVASTGGTLLVICENNKVLGVIHLKDTVKEGVVEKFSELRKMGIKTVMITGDNPITASSIAAEAGVDDFVAEATPETKLQIIKDYQKEGNLVAMTGDGTNDAPALAQADVAVAMNSGTQAAKEAGNMVDLDSSPTKLIEIVKVGKQLLMTRGALTTFSIANDFAKYFAIIPILFLSIAPGLASLNFLHLTSPATALMSATIYNALVIIALIPLSLKGVKYREKSPGKILAYNLLVYGLGGVITPFVFIKIIDLILTACGMR